MVVVVVMQTLAKWGSGGVDLCDGDGGDSSSGGGDGSDSRGGDGRW